MAMETGSGVQEVHRDGRGGGASLRGRYHLLCLCLGLLLRIYSQSQRQFVFLSCIMSSVHASVAYSMSLKKVPKSAARSQLHTLSRLGKVDIQVILKASGCDCFAEDRGDDQMDDRRKVGLWFASMGPYRKCRRDAEVTGTLTLHASSDVGCEVYRYADSLCRHRRK